ncbi:MAG: ATP synthase subunit I [Candidatus Omnitrophica bacterium]|nr:ATP synthase subunit I [Candidatus Omnitrophota bacterium]
MDMVHQFKKEVIKKSFIIAAVVLCLLVVSGQRRMFYGFLLGFGISVINFHLLSLDITKIVILARLKYASFLILKFFLRYGMSALAMCCAIKYSCNIVMFMVGLLSVQSIIFIENVLGQKQVL